MTGKDCLFVISHSTVWGNFNDMIKPSFEV